MGSSHGETVSYKTCCFYLGNYYVSLILGCLYWSVSRWDGLIQDLLITNSHMRRSHGETILIWLAEFTFIFKVMTFYSLKVITYNLKVIIYNFKVISKRNGFIYMDSSHGDTVSYKTGWPTLRSLLIWKFEVNKQNHIKKISK